MKFNEGDIVKFGDEICKILFIPNNIHVLTAYCIISPFSGNSNTWPTTIEHLRLTVDPHTYERRLAHYSKCFGQWVKFEDLQFVGSKLSILEELIEQLKNEIR